jgi:hypothetical protein
MVEAVEASVHCTTVDVRNVLDGDNQTYSAIESSVNLVKSSVTWIFSCGPNLAHFTTNWLAISCISSNIDRIDSGPNATLQSAIDS